MNFSRASWFGFVAGGAFDPEERIKAMRPGRKNDSFRRVVWKSNLCSAMTFNRGCTILLSSELSCRLNARR